MNAQNTIVLMIILLLIILVLVVLLILSNMEKQKYRNVAIELGQQADIMSKKRMEHVDELKEARAETKKFEQRFKIYHDLCLLLLKTLKDGIEIEPVELLENKSPTDEA